MGIERYGMAGSPPACATLGQWRRAHPGPADARPPFPGSAAAPASDDARDPPRPPQRGGAGPHHGARKPGSRQGWKHIVVCADDFGMTPGIDAGMLQLAAMGRLSAVSCLALGPAFAADAPALAGIDADLGVHLNLTEAFDAAGRTAVMPLPALIARAYTGRLDGAWIDTQLARQFDAFERTLGRAPDYVDGHQHVHQLPGVLPRLLDFLRRRYGPQRPWLRHTAPGILDGIPLRDAAKAHLIGALGAAALRRAAHRDGWRTNRRMLGVYGLDGGVRRYAALLHHWLYHALDGDLIMCHPGLPSSGDRLAGQRAAEYSVLASPLIGEWMRFNGVRIARLSRR